MLNKNDPLIGAVQEVMKRNHAEREAARTVNETFGIADRKALPHERQHEWDSAYKQILSEGIKALDEKVEMTKKQFANLDGNPKFTANDLAHARAGTHKKKVATGELEESDVTSPSSMGIKKPDYATGTPDYAKPKTQTVNSAEKKSLPAGTLAKTMKEENLEEKAVSKAQHRFFGLVRGIQKGKATGSAEATKAAKSMSVKSVRDYAKTKEKGLPEKKLDEKATAGLAQYMQAKQQQAKAPVVGGARPSPSIGKNTATGKQISTGLTVGGARPSMVAKNSPSTPLQKSTGLQVGGARPGLVANNTPTAKQPASTQAAKPAVKQKVRPVAKTNVAAKSPGTAQKAPSSFQRQQARQRVLAGKEGVGPEANRTRQMSGVKLGVRTKQSARPRVKSPIG